KLIRITTKDNHFIDISTRSSLLTIGLHTNHVLSVRSNSRILIRNPVILELRFERHKPFTGGLSRRNQTHNRGSNSRIPHNLPLILSITSINRFLTRDIPLTFCKRKKRELITVPTPKISKRLIQIDSTKNIKVQ